MKKKRTMIAIILAVVIVAAVGAGVGVWYCVNYGGTVTESGLESLEEDPGNVPDDNWSARY